MLASWNTKADGTGKTIYNRAQVKNLSSKNGGVVKLYARWTPKAYTIKYVLNGGTNSPYNRTTYTKKTSTFTLKNPTRKGYTFLGWYKDKYFIQKVTKVYKGSSGNKIFYAEWKPNTYMLTFDGNGALYSGMNSITCTYNKTVKLPRNTFDNQGRAFLGWNTKKDGTGVAYNDRAEVKNLSSKNGAIVTLYAQWGYGKITEGYFEAKHSGDYMFSKNYEGGGEAVINFIVDGYDPNWFSNVTFKVEDVTPPSVKKMYNSVGYPSTFTYTISELEANGYYGYRKRITVDTTAAVRYLRVTAYKSGEPMDVSYCHAGAETVWDDDGTFEAYSEDDIEAFRRFRMKVEEQLWTEDMTEIQKLNAVARYIEDTAHYPGKTTQKAYNPSYWAEWAVEGLPDSTARSYMDSDTMRCNIRRRSRCSHIGTCGRCNGIYGK